MPAARAPIRYGRKLESSACAIAGTARTSRARRIELGGYLGRDYGENAIAAVIAAPLTEYVNVALPALDELTSLSSESVASPAAGISDSRAVNPVPAAIDSPVTRSVLVV